MVLRLAPPAVAAQSSVLVLQAEQPDAFAELAKGGGYTYQWQKNGANLKNGGKVLGANSATLRISGANAATAGQYRVVITNTKTKAVSTQTAVVVLGTPTFITEPPSTLAAASKSMISLQVKTSSILAVSYQWLKNGAVLANSGARITGATTASLQIKSATVKDAGTYTVRATNSIGSATSGAAVVSVK
jgi:hypothetical protein